MRLATIFSTFATLLFCSNFEICEAQPIESKRVRALMAVDYKSRLSGVERNFQHMDEFFAKLQRSGVDTIVQYIDSNHVTPKSILNYYENIKNSENETLLFYYTGHGSTDPQYGHFLSTSGGDLLRSTLVETMNKSHPRLIILLTDCCSTSGKIGMVPSPAGPPYNQNLVKSLFLRHTGIVDITACSYKSPNDFEYAYFYPKTGGVFTDAFLITVDSGYKNNDLDLNKDGFYEWKELFPTLTKTTQSSFEMYKQQVMNGRITFDNNRDLQRLLGQFTQTPQAFSLGDRNDRSLPQKIAENGPRRPMRFGAFLHDNYGFGVVVSQTVDGFPAQNILVRETVNGKEQLTKAMLLPGDTITFANGFIVNSVESFLRILDDIPPGGKLEIMGRDKSQNLNSTYEAFVMLP